MSDPDPQQQGRASGEYRPFNDPKHPSWYSDESGTSAQHQSGQSGRTGQMGQAGQAAAHNPYADQPLAGPYGNGRPQYPIDGQYPVVANQPRRPGEPYPVAGPGPHGPGPYGRGPYAPGAPANGMAIASMVLGIIGVVSGGMLFVPQILAIILGHLGLNKDRQSRGFAIAGLVMGYLVTGLWVIGVLWFMSVMATMPY